MGAGRRTIIGSGDRAGYGEARHDKHEEVRQMHVEGEYVELDDIVH